jgi:2-methylaconitate cis-trans-isomerase PrpF
MASAIGPFAVDSGMVGVEEDGEVTVRIHNTNTGKIIHATFPVVQGEAAAEGSFAIDGVPGTAAKVELAFINPGLSSHPHPNDSVLTICSGSKTGKLLPTGNITDMLDGVEATCIDVGNPSVFIRAKDVDIDGTVLPDSLDSNRDLMSKLESIRRKASVAMGLSKDEASATQSIPKIAMVSPPTSHKLLSGETMDENAVDLVVRALSVGQPHRAVPITLAMATAVAARLEASTVNAITSKRSADRNGVTLGHPSGKIVVGAKFDGNASLVHATVFRTARRLMDGTVYWK